MATSQTSSTSETPTTDEETMEMVKTKYPETMDELAELDDQKKKLTKTLSKCKSSVRKILKRKLEKTQAQDPTATEVEVSVGDLTFRLFEKESCAPCKVDDMHTYFTPENIAKYQEGATKKRMAFSVES